jgi:hypothetical protein
MWLVTYLPEARQERAALPKAERAALINADAKLGAYGPLLGYPPQAPCVASRSYGSFGPEPDAAPGGRSTGKSGTSSWQRLSDRRPSATRAALNGQCDERWSDWRTSRRTNAEAVRAHDGCPDRG